MTKADLVGVAHYCIFVQYSRWEFQGKNIKKMLLKLLKGENDMLRNLISTGSYSLPSLMKARSRPQREMISSISSPSEKVAGVTGGAKLA